MLINYTDGNIQHIGIPSDDVDKMIDFYKSIGFSVIPTKGTEDTPVRFLGAGNIVIETYPMDGGTVKKAGAINHICLNCTDIVGCIKAVKDGGFEISEGPTFLPFFDYGLIYVYITGPNNERIEFCQKFTSQEECDKACAEALSSD